MIVLPCFYFPPVSYFEKWFHSEKIYLEQWENFPKQTYRNRCIVQGANGKLPLIVPIEHSGARIIKDIKISYASSWQKLHSKSLQSAYQSSPYFEYYEDKLIQLLEKKETFLLDLNLNTIEWACSILKLECSYELTDEYVKNPPFTDAREAFNAKKESPYKNKKYIQVFSDRFEFMNDLSILDLICNLGPKSANYLTNVE
ncbi:MULTISPECIES: WbqC family protein [Apibacter]|uniref:WbqC family protein n=1 Tax=Apibacter TaxID=1778601 RepID=UPI001C6A6B59|nr:MULTISPECIES: WbqC family protein [Apibacter]QYN51075.1 WbqC family protein [Apibacter sp. ESL0404]